MKMEKTKTVKNDAGMKKYHSYAKEGNKIRLMDKSGWNVIAWINIDDVINAGLKSMGYQEED